ncbi:uncharacterized protein LOC142980161 [Anticarsia gemmatalis]|uniref:uncharacterized protein LOC142980161 n=1 Tax=Anticarsia gemmatalis TaxID=129554 RepID=UPI003F75844A
MAGRVISSIIILSSIIALSTTSPCELKNYQGGCIYEVRCEINAGAIVNPTCDMEPYVTFTITKSYLNYLSAGFFAATNFDSRVREIKAVNNSWSKIDSAAFKYYTRSIRIDLANNKISSVNSEAFRNLLNMRYLNLSSNSIETFYAKSFLISDSRANELQELDLSFNVLQYLGSELNEVPHLKKLYLQNNKLSSLADDAFMNLRDLTHLYLQQNLLSSVNLSLIHLKSLMTIDISNNHLITLSGYEVNRLTAIVDFNISHNELTTIESNCFNQAFGLQKADFSYNDIKIKIESVMFINNNHLQYLDFYNNRIFGIEDNAFKHCNLSYLNLVNNRITGDLNENTLQNLNKIPHLDLSRQNITGIKNNAFAAMTSLTNLNLSRNSISAIENSSFVNTYSITVLDLSYNIIPNLSFLSNSLAALIELRLNNNNITVLTKHIFDNQTRLRTLDISMNNIISIEEYSLPLQNLQYLNIAGSKINGVVKRNVFSPARYLRFLDLSYFNITKIDSFAFTDLPVMAKLNLSNNHIESVKVSSFKGVDNLYSLDISYNDLHDFKFNSSNLTNLKALHLSHNKLTNISGFISSPCKLSYLDLSYNNIENVTGIGTDLLPDLTVLHLDNNKIKHFNYPKTNSLTTLIDLRLSSNGISEVNLSYFKDLLSVDLSDNNLTYINRTFLQNNDYLQALDVSRNKITDLPPGTFQFMKNLKLLNLSSNYLTRLRYGSLRGLHKTEILDLSKNKISQLDVDIFHECDELKTLIIDYNNIKTFSVERLILALKKIRTLSLGGNPILCREIVHNIKSANVTFYAIRQVEVTSIDKIYHEDNVHGIKCGDDSDDVLTTTRKVDDVMKDSQSDAVSSLTSSIVVMIWCLVLTLVVICGAVAYIKLYRNRVFTVNRNMNMQLRNSTDSSVSEFQTDLLGCLIIACQTVTTNPWTLNDEGQCFFTVISTNLSEIMSDKIPTCDYEFAEPYITFIITNTTNKNITNNFFTTTFDPHIKIIKATNNTWLNIAPATFKNFNNVLYIDLSGNSIQNINMAFKGLQALDSLNLSRNHIQLINPDTFTISENETRLHLLDLSHNLLTHLPNNLFVKIHNLRMLYLQGNKISMLGDDSFRYLKNLVYMNLCCNDLTALNTAMKYLNSLTDLDLSRNRISNLNKDTFAGLSSLQVIDLSLNNIGILPPDILPRHLHCV